MCEEDELFNDMEMYFNVCVWSDDTWCHQADVDKYIHKGPYRVVPMPIELGDNDDVSSVFGNKLD